MTDDTRPPRPSRLASWLQPFKRLGPRALPTLKYLTRTEVHTYAFSVAANAILSFFPAVVLLMTVIRKLFRSRRMLDVVSQLLQSYLPSNQSFIVGSIRKLAFARGGTQVMSVVMLVITSTGIFLPLEVALNQIWGIEKNRSYLANQLVSLGLALGCGLLALLSIAMTSGTQLLLQALFLGHVANFAFRALAWLAMKTFGLAASVAICFITFWLLPNGKIAWRAVLPAAVVTGLLLEIAKHIYILVLPLLDFRETYGPFAISVTLIFWSFVSGLLLFGGAYLSAPPPPPSMTVTGARARAA
jgi:membrane protein/epoxyqueuosine reductase